MSLSNRMMYMVTSSLMSLTPGASLYYGFMGGCVSSAAGAAAMYLGSQAAKGAEPDRVHRIAMSMAVAGLASREGVEVDDTRPIATSFPVFEALLDGLSQ